MKIGIASTYPPRHCAIGLYAANLARKLVAAGQLVHVAAEEGAAPATGGITVEPCFSRGEDYVDALHAALVRAGVDLLHIQHSPDIFGMDERLPRLLRRLASSGIPALVTLHSIYTPSWLHIGPGRRAGDFYRAQDGQCDLVVHHDVHRAVLEQQLASGRTHVIPHGTVVVDPVERSEARRRLGLPIGPCILLNFGFVHAQKNVHAVILGFALAARKTPDALLLVAGEPGGGHWYNRAYYRLVRRMSAATPAGRRVLWRFGYIPPEEVPLYYSACDVVLLPHAFQRYESSSGVFHQAIGYGRPVIASREPKFRELRELEGAPPECTVNAVDVVAWGRSMRRMIQDPDLRARAARTLSAYAEQTRWSTVAARHLALYRRVLDRTR